MKRLLLPFSIAAALVAPGANAINSFDLIAIGSLNGSADLSGLTGTLENGLPANILGGMGSGLAWAGGNTFLALPDRGPNATPYNASVDDTVSYISRFHTLDLALSASASGSLPYTLTPTLSATTLLSSATPLTYGSGAGLGNRIDGVTPLGSGAPSINSDGHYYFSGRSDNFDASLPSSNANNGRFDPEAIRVSNDGKSVFVSDEYGPYVYQFDRATGQRIRTFNLPANLAATKLSSVGDTEISGNTVGRVANKGMEGLAISPDGSTLVGVMQANLEQDKKKSLRIVTIDIASGATQEYAYKLTSGSGISEIIAINNHEFLVDERDGSGLGNGDAAVVKQLFKIDLGAAQALSATDAGDLSAKAVSKTLFLDVAAKLNANGILGSQIPAKIEGMAFGRDIEENGSIYHTLFISNDNDFVPGVAGANNIYVFAVAASDLPGYQAQSISEVPVPAAAWLFGSALLAAGGVARRKSQA